MDVLIAGANPVGLLLAVELQRRSVHFRLLEGEVSESVEVGLGPVALEILDRLGWIDEALNRGRFQAGQLTIPSGDLADLLETELLQRGGRVERGARLTEVRPKYPTVEVEVSSGAALAARWLVLCQPHPDTSAGHWTLSHPGADAGTFRIGRVFLAGDAGPCRTLEAGLQDAFNLAWKLATVARGEALDNLLDSYVDERQNGEYLAAGSIPKGDLGAAPGQLIDFVDGLQRPHLRRQARLLDLLRTGEFHLIAYGAPSEELPALAERLRQHFGAQLRVWACTDQPVPSGLCALTGEVPWGKGPGAILVRPDGYVGWRGRQAVDDELVRFLSRVSLNYRG